jgi:phage baseplate assembly protein W
VTISVDVYVPTGLAPKKRQHVAQAVRMLEKRGGVLAVTTENATEAAHVLERLAALLGSEGAQAVAPKCRVCGAELRRP